MNFSNIFESAIAAVCDKLIERNEVFKRTTNLFYVSKLILQRVNKNVTKLNGDQYIYFINQIEEASVTCAAAILYARDLNVKNFSLKAREEAFKSEYLKIFVRELNRRSFFSKKLILAAVVVVGIKFPIVYFLAGCLGSYYYYDSYELNFEGYVDEIENVESIDRKFNLNLGKAVEKLKFFKKYRAFYHRSVSGKNETLFLRIKPTVIGKSDEIVRHLYLQDYNLPGSRTGSYYLNRSTGVIYKFKIDEWIKLTCVKGLTEWGENLPVNKPKTACDVYGRFNGPYTIRIYILGPNGWIGTKKIVKFDRDPQKRMKFPDTVVIKTYCFKAFYVSVSLIFLGLFNLQF
ncbi:hypothetical protein LCDVSa117R [Lymphocystis disease virus 3]|uniref:Uncharacterized protein n=1 Tax=Lymphocystis disease virus 3 TaxID=2560566 RepID=A0A1B2RW34_9VIRU|nr:hypothetical protein BZK12_gp117 [Lymphocystis disease virus Sa]AOC55201.1 hypothetical protein LCDVSa117R [Lymphocystis disease virus 3]